jgi:hypothetical protein
MLATPALNDSMKNIREATPKVPIMLMHPPTQSTRDLK